MSGGGATPNEGSEGMHIGSARWIQLVIGIIGMVAIANLQYGWTLFVNPIDSKFHWGKATIQVAFTLFVLAETWLVPVEGYLVDRFGPRLLVAIGGILVGVAWWINAEASTLFTLYLGGLVGGVGAGIVYGTSVGNALKWFPERRGLATGLTAAAFGAGSALTVVPIANLINSRGYETAFLYFGLGARGWWSSCAHSCCALLVTMKFPRLSRRKSGNHSATLHQSKC